MKVIWRKERELVEELVAFRIGAKGRVFRLAVEAYPVISRARAIIPKYPSAQCPVGGVGKQVAIGHHAGNLVQVVVPVVGLEEGAGSHAVGSWVYARCHHR